MNDPWASFSRFESRVSEWDEFSTSEPRQRGRLNALASDTTDIEGVGGRVDVSRRRPEREGRPAHGPRDNLDAARIERRRTEQPATRARREATDEGPPEVRDTLAHIGTVRRSLTEDDYPFLYRRGQRITDAEIADIVNRSRDQIGGLSPADATQFLFGRKEEREARAPTLAEPTQPRTQREIRSGRTELPAVVETAPLTAQEAESAEWELRQEAVAAAREISQRRERLLGDSSGADRFGRGLIQNIMASAQDITSLGFRAGAEVLDRSIGGMFETPADYLDGLADWIATDAASRRQAGTPEYERGSLPYFAFGTARSMLDLTAAVGVGLTTRNPSTTAGFVMGSIVGGQETQRAIEAGYSRTTALTIGTIYGLSEMVPERIAVETFLRAAMTPGRNAAGRLVRAGATGALSEATQEGVTELIQIGLDAGVYNEQTDLAEAMLRIRDAMVMGAGAGASVATGVAAVAEISDARQRRFQEGVSAWLRDAERSAQTPTLDMAAPEGGIVSQAVNRAPNITPEDVASPIPTDLIAEGRSVIDQAVAGQDADEIASQIGASTGDSVVISLGGMERTGTVRDAFRDDDGEGVLIEWENGSTERQYLADLADAGAKIVRQDTLAPEPLASEATVAPPPRQSEAAERRGQPYFDVILQLEGGTGPNGEFLTSPAGAVGPAQVMPGTAPEAARLAGLPYDERRYRTDREYNIALGRAYYQEQLRVFRDPAMAAAAYNAGPGRVRQALRQAREQGGVWTDYLPAETQAYVENFRERTGEGGMVDFETEEPLQPDYSWMDEAEIGSDREEGVELTGGAQPSVDIEVETPRSMDEAREQLRQAGQGIRDQINAGARRFEQEAAQVVPTLPPQLVQSLRTQIVEGNADLSMPLRVEEADALRAAGASISDTNYLPKAYVDAIRSPERGPIETPSTDRATQQKQIATDAATETIRPEIAVERGNVVLRNLTESDRIRVNEALPTLARVLPRSDGTFVAPKRYEETIRTVLTGDGTRTAPVQVETAEDVRRAEQQVEPPTEAQAEVGNFRHGHVRVQGFDIAIETPKGASRSGVAPDGTRWTLDSMPATYGRIKRSRGADGENVDVYVGSHPQAMLSYVIDQVNPDTREFDESKIMLGYRNREEALADYRAAFSDGRGDERIGAVTVRDVLSLAEWMREPQTGPVGEIGSYRPTTTESEAEIAASPAATQPPAGETPAEAPTQRAAEGAAPAASGTASWVIREKATGQAIMETFDRKKVDALNTAKYEAVPIREHLASLSRGVTESVTPAFDPAPHVETLKAYVGQRGRSLAPQAVARHLGVSEQQAQRVMGALASVPNSGIFVSKRSGKVRRIPRREGPVSLYHFLRDRGGIIDNKDKAKGGRHALAKGRNLTRFPGLINNRDGMPLDEALEAAVEAGYFDTTDRQAYSEDDLLQRLENASREYRPGEAAEALERQSAREGRDDSNREAIRDAALGLAFTEEDLAAAESYMADGLSAEAAVDAAKRDAMAEVLDEGPGDFYAQVAESLYAGEIAEARGPETEPEEGGDRRTAEAEPRPESVERDAGEGGGRTEEPDRAPEAAQQDRELGKNRDGWPLFERPDGTRYFLKHGENFGRDVEMFPPHLTGGRDNLDRSIEYLTEEEIVEKARQRGITLDMFGTREGDERRALERQGEGRKKSDKQQKAPGEDGGLFDVRDTTRDIEEVTRSESNPIAQARSALQQALTALDQAEGVTRRDFIKGGAAVAGGFMIEGRLFAQPPGLMTILDRSMTESVPLEEAMDWIARNSENRQFRRFAQRIGPLVRGVVLRGGEQGQTEHQDGTPVPEAISLGEAHGMHQVDETTDGEVVWLAKGERVNGFNEGTVLHEALHAAMYRLFGNLSVRLAWNDPRMLREAGFNRETVPRTSAADLRALRSLYEDALGAYEAMVRDLALGEDQTERVRRIRNGMADPSEFISYALEDRHMQAFLRERPSREGDKTLWDRVVDFVARVLGISPEPRTALDDVLDTAYRLLNEPGGPLPVRNRPFPDQVPEVNRGLGQEVPMFQRELGDAAFSESLPDVARVDAELLRDTLESPTFSAEGLRGFDIPRQRMVLHSVFAVAQNPKVFDAIVELIPVDVVNVLASRQLTPEMLLHNEAMLQNLPTALGNNDEAVSSAIDVADALVEAAAFSAAKETSFEATFADADAAGMLIDFGTAEGAINDRQDDTPSSGVEQGAGEAGTSSAPTTLANEDRQSQLRRMQSRPVSEEEAIKTAERLQTELNALGISDRITLKVANGLLTKKLAQGAYFRRAIYVSLDKALNPDATLNHEAIHAMKALGLFTSSEWTALVKQAWADEGVWTFVNRGYPTAQDSKRDEEAVAEFYSRWRTQRMEAKGFASRALQRILDFLAALGRAAAYVLGKPLGAGTVLRRIESGKVGRRQTGEGVWAESGTPLLQEGGDGFGFDPEQPQRSMTERQRAEMEARLKQSKIRRGGQQSLGDQQGGMFDAERDQGMLFMAAPTTALWNDMLNGARTLTGAAKIPGATDKFWAALDRLRTNMQDRMLPLLRTQTAIEQVAGRELSEEERPYRQEALYTGRVGSQFEQMEDSIINPLFEAMAENKVGVEELESYLYARHAPERNAKLKKEGVENGSGMSDIEAAAIMARIDKAGKTDALKQVASWYDKLIGFALDTRVAGGLMSQETADEWRALYPNYAPLRGMAEMAEAERPNVGKGFTVKGPESKRAFGRKSRAEDLLAYAMVQAEEAIIRAEKNRVAVELYNLAKANPDPNFWQVQKVTMKKRVNPDTGLIESYPVTVLLPEDAPFTVSVKLNGKQSRVTFNKTNPAAVRAAAAMRRLNEPELNVRAFQIINMWLSKANTMLNPDFIWRNAIRDLETAVANLSEFDMKGLRRDVLKSYPKALRAAERGAFKREARNDWDRAWAEFTAEGGRVFYNQIQDVDELRRDINKRFARLTRKKKPTPKEAGLLMWEGLKWTFDKIEKVNLGVENAVRLSAYKNLRDRGVSQKQAAFIAKELTVNFNRRGVYGVLMNSLYLFYNATTQGSTRMLLALRHKRTRKVAMAMIVAGAMNALYNVLASGGDDDEESVYDQLSEYEKSTNMIFMIPGTDRYIKIPVAYGYNIFFEIGRHLVDVGRGRSTPLEASGNWLYTALNSFNPIGGQEALANFIAPTVFDPAVDLMVDNRNFADMPIMPDDSPFEPPVPDSQRYWPSVSPIFRTLTDALNQGTGGDEVVPGWIDVSPESLEYMTGYVTGAAGATIMRFGGGIAKVLDGTPETALEINDVPIARTMTGTTPSWYPRAAFYTRLEHVEEVVGNAREYIANRDREGLRSYRRSESDVLSLRDEARAARREIREIRRARARLDVEVGVGRITDAQRERARLRLADRESRLIEAWNSIYLRTVESPRRPDR